MKPIKLCRLTSIPVAFLVTGQFVDVHFPGCLLHATRIFRLEALQTSCWKTKKKQGEGKERQQEEKEEEKKEEEKKEGEKKEEEKKERAMEREEEDKEGRGRDGERRGGSRREVGRKGQKVFGEFITKKNIESRHFA